MGMVTADENRAPDGDGTSGEQQQQMGMMGQQMRIGPQMGMGHQVSSRNQCSGSESGSGSTCLLRFHANRDRYQYIIIFQPRNICVFNLNRYRYLLHEYITYTNTVPGYVVPVSGI
jgi:hypothetical protein